MSIATSDERRAGEWSGERQGALAADSLLRAYAMSGVVETVAESLAVSPAAVDAGLRSGHTLRELAHEFRVDPGELQLALARGAQSALIDDRTAAHLILGAGALLDRPLDLDWPPAQSSRK